MNVKTLLFASLFILSGAAFAATPPASTGAALMGHHEGPCKTDPQKCKDAAAKFDQWCSANADKCTILKAWAEKRIEHCQANAKECEERMHRMHEHMKDWCAKNADDEHCKMMKSNDDDMGGDMPPPPGA